MADPNKESPRAFLGSLVGGMGGWALSQYTGASLWIPGGVALIAALVFTKSAFRPVHFAGAVAVILGHLTWFVVAAVIGGAWAPVILDIVILAAGLSWLWARPGLGPVLMLGAFEVLALVNNGVGIASVAIGTVEHRALTAHCLFRVLALAALAVGYRNLRKTLLTAGGGVAPS